MIKIITDTASDILPKEGEQLGIKVLPLTITFDKTEYIDGVTLSQKKFYEKLIESTELPKTSQITPYAFQQAFEEFKDDDVVCITLSRKLSGTYNSARIAAEDYPNVRVIDSNNVTIGERIIVLRALELAKEGKTADEIVEIIEDEKDIAHVIGLVETLEYLKKGGRISPLVAVIGNFLKIKPVVEVNDGEIKMLGKARGSLAGNNKLREQVSEYGGVDFSRPFAVAYSGLDSSVLNKYLEDSKDLYPEGFVFERVQIGSTVGTHVGPGCVAVAFFSYKERKDKQSAREKERAEKKVQKEVKKSKKKAEKVEKKSKKSETKKSK